MNLYAVQQVMLDSGEHAAPVTTIDGFVNNPTALNINLIAAEDFVVDSSEKVEQSTLLSRRRPCSHTMRQPIICEHVDVVSAPAFRSVTSLGFHGGVESFNTNRVCCPPF